MTGGSVAHQVMVFNLLTVLHRLLAGGSFRILHEMRVRVDAWVRYPDVLACAGPLDQTTRTLTDAVAMFEVLSDDTATTDRVIKLLNYADVPSLRCYVLLEQTAMAATLYQREPGGAWIATPHTDGSLVLPGLDITLPPADVYQGLIFEAQNA
jgi:Uma2 family endonuclease